MLIKKKRKERKETLTNKLFSKVTSYCRSSSIWNALSTWKQSKTVLSIRGRQFIGLRQLVSNFFWSLENVAVKTGPSSVCVLNEVRGRLTQVRHDEICCPFNCVGPVIVLLKKMLQAYFTIQHCVQHTMFLVFLHGILWSTCIQLALSWQNLHFSIKVIYKLLGTAFWGK